MPSIYNLFPIVTLFFGLALGSQAGLEKRQDLTGLPTCSQPCLVSSLATSSGGCSQTDFVCLCKSVPFLLAASKCYQSSCSAADASAATSWGLKTCAGLGVTVPGASATTNTTTSGTGSTGTNSTTSTTTSSSAKTSSSAAANAAQSSASTETIPIISLAVAMVLGSLFA